MEKLFTEKFDQELQGIDVLKKFNQLMPWIGIDYDDQNHKKVLLIGESHYLPEGSTIHSDSGSWYNSNINDLTEDEREWTCTREIISCGQNQVWKAGGHRIYRNIEKAIIESGFNPINRLNMFRYVSYINFFYRPGKEGDSIISDKNDEDVSICVFSNLVKIIKPQLICFLSLKSWHVCRNRVIVKPTEDNSKYYYFEDKSLLTDFFPHPAMPWWNKKNRNYMLKGDTEPRTGKEKFIGFLQREKAF